MISAKEIHSYLQNHTINDACKHFKCSFKELCTYAKMDEPYEENTPKYDMKYIRKRNGRRLRCGILWKSKKASARQTRTCSVPPAGLFSIQQKILTIIIVNDDIMLA